MRRLRTTVPSGKWKARRRPQQRQQAVITQGATPTETTEEMAGAVTSLSRVTALLQTVVTRSRSPIECLERPLSRFQTLSEIQPVTEPDKAKRLTKMVMRLFEHWELDTESQLTLLGLSPTSRSVLSTYRKGERAPSSVDAMDRVSYLLAIHKNLRLLFPDAPKLAYGWIKHPCPDLENQTPLTVMKRSRIPGLNRVLTLLDDMVAV